MITLTLMENRTGNVFEKNFDDFELARKFLIKLRYSKKLTRISLVCDDYETLYELERWA